MTETPQEQRPSADRQAGEDVEDVERGSEPDKGSLEDEIERAREREEEATEG